MSVFLTPELQPFLGGALHQHASHASCLKHQSALRPLSVPERCFQRPLMNMSMTGHGGCLCRHILPAH